MSSDEGFRIAAELAWENIAKTNAHARWNAAPGDRRWETSATYRLQQPYCVPAIQPGFAVSRSDRVFCMGSCFARHIEDALIHLNFDVPSRVAGPEATDILNKYNSFSMLNELRWALEPDAFPFPEASLIADSGGVVDPHLSFGGIARPLEQVLDLRARVANAVSQIRTCNLVILTLGLVEAWYDAETGVYLSEAPPFRACRRSPGRYELQVLSYRQNLEALEAIYDLIRRHGRPDVKLVVTVSPVPFQATFGADDVLVANTYSKATLRAVAGDFVRVRPNVDYLPSFESVTNSRPDLAWEEDRIHVTPTLVRLNLLNFLAHYLEGESGLDMAAQRVRLLAAAGQTDTQASANVGPPDFEGELDVAAFPSGIPKASASSAMTEEFGPGNLCEGPIVPWHAVTPPTYPQVLNFEFAEPLSSVQLWLQAQDRHPERAPTRFFLEGLASDGDGAWRRLLQADDVRWEFGGQWRSWPLASSPPMREYRLTIEEGSADILTLQRVWLQPATALHNPG